MFFLRFPLIYLFPNIVRNRTEKRYFSKSTKKNARKHIYSMSQTFSTPAKVKL